MPKTHSWRALRDKRFSPEQIARMDAAVQRTVNGLALLRRAREMTQGQLSATLGMTQPEVSKLEHRTDMYVSTLRRFIEAMGGTMEITARFPDGEALVDLAPTDSDVDAAWSDIAQPEGVFAGSAVSASA
jgi:transcriptional regulator with XRE-family HTH domain